MPDVPVWVLDTNVIVSGLLSASGPPGRLVDMVLARRLMLAVDDRIELEYREVLARPKFTIDPIRQEAFLAILQFQVHVIAEPWAGVLPPDPDDAIFLEVAAMTSENSLVTGNVRHYPKRVRGHVHVLTPREAWEQL
jgi:putative PIN family toxin of toxin-antitoxin system